MSLGLIFWQIESGKEVRVRGKNLWDSHKERQIRFFDIKISNIETFKKHIFVYVKILKVSHPVHVNRNHCW